MFLNKDSVLVNGISYGKYLLSIKYGYNKIWSSDTGRNLVGTQSGTLVGVFPKLEFTFRNLTQQELEDIAPVLDSAIQTTTYYDPVLKRMYPMSTYTGDWATLNKNTFSNVARANESFSISFIARKKRSNI